MSDYGQESPRDKLMRHMYGALLKDGYATSGAMAEEYGQAFERMRADAAEGRKKPTAANGREAALTFLKATVEDENRPMAERMGAAALLMQHGEEK